MVDTIKAFTGTRARARPSRRSRRGRAAVMEVEALVVGAGVVGLAVARQLARAGLETVVADGEASFGSWTSSRNSEVIHAGIYYPAGSGKAALCVRGRDLLYDYCARAQRAARPYRQADLRGRSLRRPPRSTASPPPPSGAGVFDLERLGGGAARAIEPALDCHEALLSPSTGIIDAHAYMTALLADAEDAGAVFARGTSVTRLTRAGEGLGGAPRRRRGAGADGAHRGQLGRP